MRSRVGVSAQQQRFVRFERLPKGEGDDRKHTVMDGEIDSVTGHDVLLRRALGGVLIADGIGAFNRRMLPIGRLSDAF